MTRAVAGCAQQHSKAASARITQTRISRSIACREIRTPLADDAPGFVWRKALFD
jgi:hypothetical protein